MKITKKRFFLPLVISAGAVALLLLAALVTALWKNAVAAALPEQHAAKRWSDGAYAQVSAFLPSGREISFDEAFAKAQTVDRKLLDNSLSASGNGRLWYAAYSGETSVYAMTSRASSQLYVTVYGGDFFLIHQPELVSGGYPGTDGASAGAILLDDNAAWRLFGALDVAGMELTINGNYYIVCGVVKALKGSVWDAAYGENYRAWLYCEAPDAGMADVSCYEAVLPNPLENFAANAVKELFTDPMIVENSTRFGVGHLVDSLKNRRLAAVREKAYAYPWWENLALAAEYRCASLLNAELAFFLLAGLIVLVWIGIAWMPASRGIAKLARAVWEGVPDKINTWRWNKTHNPSSQKTGPERPGAAPADNGVSAPADRADAPAGTERKNEES